MTLRSRNILVTSLFVIVSLCLVSYIVLLFVIDPTKPSVAGIVEQGISRYLFVTWNLEQTTPFINMVGPGVCILIAWSAAFVFLRNFRRISSPQLFFFLLFWISLAFEFVRMVNILVLADDLSLTTRIILTRVDTFGRLFASMSLFAASLYATGIKLQQQGVILTVMFVIAGALSYLIPLDSTLVGQNLLFLSAEGYSLDVFRIVTGMLTVTNFVKQAITSRDAQDLLMVLPILLLFTGQELAYATSTWLGVVTASVLLGFGTLWLTRRFMNSYLWY